MELQAMIRSSSVWNPTAALTRLNEAAQRAWSMPYERASWGRSIWDRRPIRPSLYEQFRTENPRGWPCNDCACSPITHRLDAVTGRGVCTVCDDCAGYISDCAVCGGYDVSANRKRVCRPCRRLMERKERELWVRHRSEQRQRASLREGAKTLKQLRRLLSDPVLLQSAAEASALARTSRTS